MTDPLLPTTTISEDPISRLAELLKHPDDLDKLPSLKAEFTRKKATIDAQLKIGLKDQLEVTQNGMSSITAGHTTVQQIKDEMQKIDRLCSEAQGMIRDFPEINRMSVMQRNFAAVESMKASVDGFAERLAEIEELLREDDQDLEGQGNLLAVHEGLTALRDVRDLATEQVKGAMVGGDGESGVELMENLALETNGATMRDYFARLDEVVDWFDEHVGQACLGLIQLVQAGNNGLVVRLGLVIEEEEKKDRQVKALQDAQREFQDVAMRFKSINVGTRELRGYKKKFLQAIEATAQAQFDGVKQAFLEDPDKIEKSCRWFFNDLNTVKLGMQDLLPPKWRIFRTYTTIYHRLMHDFLTAALDDDTSDSRLTPVHMLAILNWVPKYHSKMSRLGVDEFPTNLLANPHVIDDRESELVREYRTIITRAVEEWMSRMAAADRKAFTSRDEASLDQDADGHLHTKSLADMWTMLREQLFVAQASGRPDVVEGVVDSMMRALKSRQQMWESLVDAEFRSIDDAASATTTNPAEIEGISAYQDWLLAIANDQITNIDDQPATNTTSFLTRFKHDYDPIVSPSYPLTTAATHDALTNGYIDLASHCTSLFARLLFATDFRSVSRTFFTPTWYADTPAATRPMAQITTTFEDYLAGDNNITQVLHPSLRDILVEELSDALLITYLEAVKSRSAKFRRSDPFTERIREDIMTVFGFFSKYPDAFELIKEKWRVVQEMQNLLSAEKGRGVVEAFVGFKERYWDVQLGWVESVLRARDDFDRAMLGSVKGAAAEVGVERGPETVMSKVK